MENNIKIIDGLKPTPKDERDFKFGKIFGTINIEEIPDNFVIAEPLEIKDQGNTDYCSAYSGCSVSEDQEKVKLYPEWFFAQIKKISGDPDSWGANLRDVAKAGVKIGFIPKGISNNDWERERVVNWKNWNFGLYYKAKEHRKKSYLFINRFGYKDLFDSIRACLWQNREGKCSIVSGAFWKNEWVQAEKGIIPDVKFSGGGGHAFKIFGQKTIEGKQYLMIQNSYGENVGDKGIFYFPREVVNREFIFGSFIWHDIEREDVEFLNNHNLTIKWKIVAKIINFFKNIWNMKN